MFEKCACQNCGQHIEYPSEGNGQIVPCPACNQPVELTPLTRIIDEGAKPEVPKPEFQKRRRLPPAPQLTAETIQWSTKSGDTPLHRVAKKGNFNEIPDGLLQVELFTRKNNRDQTPVHVAAQEGLLNKIPAQYLTRETMTVSTEYGTSLVYTQAESKTGSTPPKTETPLHTAVRFGHADQIPKEFLAPEFLRIEATGYRLTVLHYLADADQLGLVPIIYGFSSMWGLKDSSGMTPKERLKEKKERDAYIANVRREPATEKQKEKLRWFGYGLKVGMTKGEASDAIDECVRQFPEKDRDYYNRPATEEQLAQLREYCKTDGDLVITLDELKEEGSALTYEEAKNLMADCRGEAEQQEMDRLEAPANKVQLAKLTEAGIKLDRAAKITAGELEDILKLEGAMPRREDLNLFKQHGINSFKGDGFAAFALGDLIRSFGGSAQDHNRSDVNYGDACQAALRDPAYLTPTLTRDWEGCMAFAWPKSKIKDWLRR
jgi:hypothetical protein